MAEKMDKSAILKEADRFSDLSKCKREPVSKLPLDINLLSGLQWADDGNKVPEAVDLFMVNSFFTFIEAPDSIPGNFNNTRSKFINKHPEAEKLARLAESFNPAALDSFTEALAKQLVKMIKGREVKTRDLRKALLVFGLMGRDKAFSTLFKGKAYKVKHRRGLFEVFTAALRINGSPYTALLGQALHYNEPSLKLLQNIKKIREIFTAENLLTDKNAVKKKKLQENRLPGPVNKHTEKLITEFYLDIVEDGLFVRQDLKYGKWKNFFVDDLCGLKIARSIVWGLHDEEQKTERTFTLDVNGGAVDHHGEALTDIDFDKFAVNPVHPVELSLHEITTWRNYFTETGSKQLVEQLERPLFKPASHPLDRYLLNPEILPDSFWKRKLGWWKIVEESGVISSFKRNLSVANGVKISIEIETYIDRRNPYFEAPVLKNLQISKDGAENWNLKNIPDRMYSELCRELEKYFLRRL